MSQYANAIFPCKMAYSLHCYLLNVSVFLYLISTKKINLSINCIQIATILTRISYTLIESENLGFLPKMLSFLSKQHQCSL